MTVEECTLNGRTVRLEPLRRSHAPALWKAGSDPEVWRWTSARIASVEDMERYVADALREQQLGTALPFVTVVATGEVAGTTRFGNIVPAHRRVEIGWTFVSPSWQRTAVNTEAKYLMLRHAFEEWKCHRVELKTSHVNEKSRRAILRIGATQEGVFRKHMINDDGTIRDTVYFSITDDEWPQIKRRLEARLAPGERS
jgi:RimJ/RimL family protein N-acetyltransferase